MRWYENMEEKYICEAEIYHPTAFLDRHKPFTRRKDQQFHGPPSMTMTGAAEAYQ